MRPLALATLVLLSWIAGCGAESAPEATSEAALAAVEAPAEPAMDENCPHHAQKPSAEYARTEAVYSLPELTLTDRSGQSFDVQSLDREDRPVVLNFIFATCTTICPVMTATFSRTRVELGEDAERVHMVSITIDPTNDTPSVLAEYAERFEAPASWSFLTGQPDDVTAVLRAFDADFGTKLNHRPLTLLRAPGAAAWVRLDGLGNSAELAREVRSLLDGPGLR